MALHLFEIDNEFFFQKKNRHHCNRYLSQQQHNTEIRSIDPLKLCARLFGTYKIFTIYSPIC